jgi:two-component system CheB/CheR fusion protein
MVSCRNLLIYFGAETQNQVIPTFYYSLRPGGYLFLGTAENVSQFTELFTPIEKKQRIFRRRDDGSVNIRIPMMLNQLQPSSTGRHATGGATITGAALRQRIEAQVLERSAPAHVVVNGDGDIIYYSARTGKYLEPPAGIPNRQLLVMARRGLRLELRSAFRDAIETNQTITRSGLALEDDGGHVQTVSITVEPLVRPPGEDPLYIVLFSDRGPLLTRESADERLQASSGRDVAHVETELRETKERLQSLVEEYETALEELKSSNEELVSVNEELQSTNEELEASKEELQSLNEELHTVNAELNGKIEALDSAANDLQNLFESTQVATVFLDRNLAIRSFTPAVSSIFNVIPSDKGRPLTDLASRMALPTLAEDVRTVFSTGQSLERRIAHGDHDQHFLVRIVPYTDVDVQTAGVVVTFLDVTVLTRAEEQQRVLIAELNHRVKNMLAIVTAIAEQTHRSSPTLDGFKTAFLARLHAMARSYELLSRESWTEASIETMARQELGPFGEAKFTLAGPDIRLKPRQALSFGMIIHELATNAGKYGALSVDGGMVELHWDVGPKSTEAHVTWDERNGPTPKTPSRQGLGLKLVERETTHSLNGNATIAFNPTGLHVELWFENGSGDNA